VGIGKVCGGESEGVLMPMPSMMLGVKMVSRTYVQNVVVVFLFQCPWSLDAMVKVRQKKVEREMKVWASEQMQLGQIPFAA